MVVFTVETVIGTSKTSPVTVTVTTDVSAVVVVVVVTDTSVTAVAVTDTSPVVTVVTPVPIVALDGLVVITLVRAATSIVEALGVTLPEVETVVGLKTSFTDVQTTTSVVVIGEEGLVLEFGRIEVVH